MKSQLVKDRDTGELCIQVSLGQHTATLPLPADCVNWHRLELEAYMEKVVPDMIESLQQRVRAERRTIFKRAKHEMVCLRTARKQFDLQEGSVG